MNNRLTEEQIREWRAQRPPLILRKPRPALVTPVSPKLLEAVKANPGSVRVTAKAEDGTTVIERPRRSDVVEVLEADAQGRATRARSYDPTTGEHGTIEYEGGYRRPAGAVSNYNPLDGLKGGE